MAGSSVLRIDQQEPSNKPPAILSIIMIISSLILLAFGLWGTYLWANGTVSAKVDISTILFFMLFIILPIAIIASDFIIERRASKLGRSIVAKEAEIVLGIDANTCFDKCREVLHAMNAIPIKINKPDLLKARWKDCVITVTIRHRKGSRVKVNILSDSQWMTVIFDLGVNQRCIDAFLSELSKQ